MQIRSVICSPAGVFASFWDIAGKVLNGRWAGDSTPALSVFLMVTVNWSTPSHFIRECEVGDEIISSSNNKFQRQMQVGRSPPHPTSDRQLNGLGERRRVFVRLLKYFEINGRSLVSSSINFKKDHRIILRFTLYTVLGSSYKTRHRYTCLTRSLESDQLHNSDSQAFSACWQNDYSTIDMSMWLWLEFSPLQTVHDDTLRAADGYRSFMTAWPVPRADELSAGRQDADRWNPWWMISRAVGSCVCRLALESCVGRYSH